MANGYVGHPELKAAAFMETPQGRLYRSGDLGRWHSNGEMEILGRIDEQVKLNGIRIELGEIEAILSLHPSVAQAVVLLDDSAEKAKSLWAFVRLTPGSELPTDEIWREYLAHRLPVYMIPSAVIVVPAIPLTNSGKVDKTALKKLLDGSSSQSEESLPRNGLETEIARVWSDLLGHNHVHRGDNFFSLGGHSLLAIAVAQRLEEMLGYPIPARELFVEPTLAGFARRLGELSNTVARAPVSSDRATEGQREFWVAEQAGLDTRSFNIALTLMVSGRVPTDLQWRHAWALLVERHTNIGRSMDAKTGTIQIEAQFPNPTGILVPGMSGKIRMPIQTSAGAVLVPKNAVFDLHGSKAVAIVTPDMKVDIRSVEAAGSYQGMSVVIQGLSGGESVIVDGMAQLQSGQRVTTRKARVSR